MMDVKRNLTDSVELFWVTCGQSEDKTNLIEEVSRLDYGHRGMLVWYPSPGANAFKQEDFLQLDPELEFDREVYPLGLLPNAGVAVGVYQRMSFSASAEFPCFECPNGCQNLKFLPELPFSITDLEACNCDSLQISKFNNLSRVCSAFASHSQDHAQVLQMGITGREIPSWFVHQQKGNSVTVPHNCPLNERLGIALCFLLQPSESALEFSLFETMRLGLAIRSGDMIIKDKISTEIGLGCHLYVVCLTNEYFSDEFHQDNHFKLSIEDDILKDDWEILSSAANWVRVEDMEDLNKNEELQTRRSRKRKRKQEEIDLIKSKRKREEEDLIESFAQMEIV